MPFVLVVGSILELEKIMNKLILLPVFSLLTSCSVTFVYAPKSIYAHGKNHEITITGSDLKGNSANQSADGTLKIPFTGTP